MPQPDASRHGRRNRRSRDNPDQISFFTDQAEGETPPAFSFSGDPDTKGSMVIHADDLTAPEWVRKTGDVTVSWDKGTITIDKTGDSGGPYVEMDLPIPEPGNGEPISASPMMRLALAVQKQNIPSMSRLSVCSKRLGCGPGNFLGLLPDNMAGSQLTGVELDSITGRIAEQLYQLADIHVCGFERTNFRDNSFDAALGNVPFGAYRVNDSRYNYLDLHIHDYFICKTLDLVRPKGIIAFITSKGTLDKVLPDVRRYIAERADLIGAVRLPNTAFKANAGTEVTTDILFLQKRINLNKSMYGSQRDTALYPFPDTDLAAQLDQAICRI